MRQEPQGTSDFRLRSQGCGRQITYGEDKRLTGVGFDFPFEFVAQWYDYQKEFVNHLMVNEHTQQPLYCDVANLSQVIVYKEKLRLRSDADIRLYGDRVVIDEGSAEAMVFPFDQVTVVSVLGRNKLNIYYNDKVYQFKGSKSFNALKYVNIYYRYRNITRGNADGKFLGL